MATLLMSLNGSMPRARSPSIPSSPRRLRFATTYWPSVEFTAASASTWTYHVAFAAIQFLFTGPAAAAPQSATPATATKIVLPGVRREVAMALLPLRFARSPVCVLRASAPVWLRGRPGRGLLRPPKGRDGNGLAGPCRPRGLPCRLLRGGFPGRGAGVGLALAAGAAEQDILLAYPRGGSERGRWSLGLSTISVSSMPLHLPQLSHKSAVASLVGVMRGDDAAAAGGAQFSDGPQSHDLATTGTWPSGRLRGQSKDAVTGVDLVSDPRFDQRVQGAVDGDAVGPAAPRSSAARPHSPSMI